MLAGTCLRGKTGLCRCCLKAALAASPGLTLPGSPLPPPVAALAGWWCWADALVYQQAVLGVAYPWKYNWPGIGAHAQHATAAVPMHPLQACLCCNRWLPPCSRTAVLRSRLMTARFGGAVRAVTPRLCL